jgi:hypothetical protein
VRAYLQVACAGLGFDIGEIWWTHNDNGSSSAMASIGKEERWRRSIINSIRVEVAISCFAIGAFVSHLISSLNDATNGVLNSQRNGGTRGALTSQQSLLLYDISS